MMRALTSIDGRELDLMYFVEWRPYLWKRPIWNALEFVGDLRGKRVLEIGGRYGRMTSLFALRGAEVTMLDHADLAAAKSEVQKWGVADRVRLIRTRGGFEDIAGETFDVVFTKSVLWCIEDLRGFVEQIDLHLAVGGKVAFVENYRGGKLLFWLRRNVLRRGQFKYEQRYIGITPSQLPIFRECFAQTGIRRYRYFVYEIFGEKRTG